MNAERAEQMAGDESLAPTIAHAYRLHCQHVPYREIGRQLDVSTGTAWNWVQKARAALDFATGDEAAERARDLAAADRWLERLDAAADTAELDLGTASREARGWLARRAAMIGYDAPRKSAITIEPEREPPTPDMDLLAALADAKEHARKMQLLEESDGLFDSGGTTQ